MEEICQISSIFKLESNHLSQFVRPDLAEFPLLLNKEESTRKQKC